MLEGQKQLSKNRYMAVSEWQAPAYTLPHMVACGFSAVEERIVDVLSLGIIIIILGIRSVRKNASRGKMGRIDDAL